MPQIFTLLAVYCVFIVFASMCGGWLSSILRMTHLRTQLMMSFVAGLMLGIAMLHMLPHASTILGSGTKTGAAALVGIIAMFLLLRAFHTHQHGEIACPVDPSDTQVTDEKDSHEHSHSHSHACDHAHEGEEHADKNLGWLGMLFGLGLHTLMDGVALAASVAADWHPSTFTGLAGFGTFLAVALHKPLDAFAITSVMKKSGWPVGQRNMVNLAFSLACPIGAFLFYIGATQTQLSENSAVLGWGLAISAGFFICISLSDLLPEVSFHDHDRGKLTAALLAGVFLAVAIESVPGHKHDHPHDQNTSTDSQASSPINAVAPRF